MGERGASDPRDEPKQPKLDPEFAEAEEARKHGFVYPEEGVLAEIDEKAKSLRYNDERAEKLSEEKPDLVRTAGHIISEAFAKQPPTEDEAIAQAGGGLEKLSTPYPEYIPDTRDLPYATIVEAFAVEGKKFDLPEDVEWLEKEFTQEFSRVTGLVADAEGTLRRPNLQIDGDDVDLLNRCREELVAMQGQRRRLKESFRGAVTENKLKQARLILDSDLKGMGHPADTATVRTAAELRSDGTFFMKLNFFQANLEHLLRRYSR